MRSGWEIYRWRPSGPTSRLDPVPARIACTDRECGKNRLAWCWAAAERRDWLNQGDHARRVRDRYNHIARTPASCDSSTHWIGSSERVVGRGVRCIEFFCSLDLDWGRRSLSSCLLKFRRGGVSWHSQWPHLKATGFRDNIAGRVSSAIHRSRRYNTRHTALPMQESPCRRFFSANTPSIKAERSTILRLSSFPFPVFY
jgi:hypothetical protein